MMSAIMIAQAPLPLRRGPTLGLWLGVTVAVLFASVASASPEQLSPATNSPVLDGTWHQVVVTPRTDIPRIRTRDKFNPAWWFKNVDDPTPQDWYKPADPRRTFKWHVRNSLHNFTFYVVGIADKKFKRSGRYPG